MSTTIITFRHRVDGVPQDVQSILLADPANTYGVRRDDTTGIIVASGTPLAHQGDGVYEFQFTDPAPGLTYTYWLQWSYAGQTFQQEFHITGGDADTAQERSYLSVARADALAVTLSGLEKYKAATADDRAAALLLASIDIDSAGPYQGRKYQPGQGRQFPRVADDGPAGVYCEASADVTWDWDAVTSNAVVPADVELAVLFQADAICRGAGARDQRLQAIADGLASQAVGSLSENYQAGVSPSVLCLRAAQLMAGYRLRSGMML